MALKMLRLVLIGHEELLRRAVQWEMDSAHIEHVLSQRRLDTNVERRGGVEARRDVHFDEPRSELAVHQYIHAE